MKASDYPIIFHEILKAGGGLFPFESMGHWKPASVTTRWYSFVRMAAGDFHLGPYARHRHWSVKLTTSGLEITSKMTAMGLAIKFVDPIKGG